MSPAEVSFLADKFAGPLLAPVMTALSIESLNVRSGLTEQ